MRDNWESIDFYLIEKGFKVGRPDPAQTTGGRHVISNGHFSNHFYGLARDYGRESDAAGIAMHLELIAMIPTGPIAELYYAPFNIWYKDGHKLPNGNMGSYLLKANARKNETTDCCHVALQPGRWLL